MAVTCGWTAFTIYAEQKWLWASRLSGVVIALLGALLLTNLGVLPTNCVWFDEIIWGYAVPLAIPLLLLQCDIRKIGQESGRLLLLFLIGSAGTVCGTLAGFSVLHKAIPESGGIAAMLAGSYIGGTVNLVAMAETFRVLPQTVSATVVADNLLMSLYFFVLILFSEWKLFHKYFKHPYIEHMHQNQMTEQTQAAAYWGKKPISLQDIALNLAISICIVWLSTELADWFSAAIPQGNGFLTDLAGGLFGNKYLILTTMTMLLATCFSKRLAGLSGSQEIGTYLIYLFFFAVGAPASVRAIFQNAPLVLVFAAIIVMVNMFVCFLFGRLLHFTLEECILASNACIGGPTTAAAMAISKGWTALIGPIMLIGTLGYVIGTYAGTCIGQLLGA